jgi:hypothetical protein
MARRGYKAEGRGPLSLGTGKPLRTKAHPAPEAGLRPASARNWRAFSREKPSYAAAIEERYRADGAGFSGLFARQSTIPVTFPNACFSTQ